MRQIAQPVTQKFAATYNPEMVKLYNDELTRIRGNSRRWLSTGSTAMTRLVFVLNGPNLNMLGKREPHIYGTTTLAEIRQRTEALASELGLQCEFRQTNHEGTHGRLDPGSVREGCGGHHQPGRAVLRLHSRRRRLEADPGTVVEVHISNIHQRDEQHRHSSMSLTATGVICGLGGVGYLLALRAVAEELDRVKV